MRPHLASPAIIVVVPLLFAVILQKIDIAKALASPTLSDDEGSYKNYDNGGGSAIDDDEYRDSRENILQSSYHGLIKENETMVEITPLIKVDEKEICGFHIIKNNRNNHFKDIPFEMELINDLGILKAKKSLNCEKRKNYRFPIQAIFCDGRHSKSANVHISVIDINEYAPIFLQPSYVTEVDEGRLYQEIIHVEATDKDCTPLFGDVCKYEILTEDQPFTIDNEGSIRNIEPLSHKISHNHILSVVAYDCAMKQSTPVMVNIRVRRICEPKLIGVPERIDYTANSMEYVSLFPNLHLELCEMQCKSDTINIQTSVTLKTKHISFGCDRDTNKCLLDQINNSASSHQNDDGKTINLLPKDAVWSKDLFYDEGPETIYHFDGTTGVIIPKNYVPVTDFASTPFSISTMFRHHSRASNDKHTKEHIICSADDHKMNRHHMALFVRNCRLIFLLRQNFNDGNLNIFSPAEWRWKLPQVCDNEWHHYVVNVNLPKIELFIDGISYNDMHSVFENSMNLTKQQQHSTTPEVIDDWPLHAAHGINTTLTLGACYQASEERLKHGFSGDIAEIKLLLNNVMTKDTIKCLTECSEQLVPPTETMLEPEQQIQINTHLNEIIIEGSQKANIELLLKKIQYVNKKNLPTIGRRNIVVQTTVNCQGRKAIRLPVLDTYIMVTPNLNTNIDPNRSLQQSNNVMKFSSFNQNHIVHDKILTDTQKPRILISGNTNHLVAYPDIKNGVHIMADINITIFIGNENVRSNLQRLDACTVSVFPNLNPDHEEIMLLTNAKANDEEQSLSIASSSKTLLTGDINTNINKYGVEMVGYDTVDNYLRILKLLTYSNKKPAYYLNRVFKLSCAQVNEHFKSGEFTLTLTVLHPKQSPAAQFNSNRHHNADMSNYVFTKVPTPGSPSPLKTTNPKDNDLNLHNKQQPHEQQFELINKIFSHAMIHQHDVIESQSHVRTLQEKMQHNSHSTMLIVVICSAFVFLIGGVGVARLRNNQQNNSLQNGHNLGGINSRAGSSILMNKQQQQQLLDEKNQSCSKMSSIDQQQQLDWDDSSLTITINPMQNGQLSDESSDSDNSDSDDEEVINGRYKNVNQLEWDNSTL